jgi:hypothetical protein
MARTKLKLRGSKKAKPKNIKYSTKLFTASNLPKKVAPTQQLPPVVLPPPKPLPSTGSPDGDILILTHICQKLTNHLKLYMESLQTHESNLTNFGHMSLNRESTPQDETSAQLITFKLKEQLLSDLFNSTDLDEERTDKIKKGLEVYEDDYRNYPISVRIAQRKIETDLESIVKETMSKIYTIKEEEEEEEPTSSNQPDVDEANLLKGESVQDDDANWPEVFDFPIELLKKQLIQKLEDLKGPITEVDLRIVTRAIVDKIRSCGVFYPSHHQYLQAAKSFIDFYPNIKPKSSEKTQIFTVKSVFF